MIVALLPVRNGGNDLDDWFAGMRDVVDGVIALDDGSTDDTASRLRAEPLVRQVLANRVRPDETGWDDRDNRQRLLEAAVDAGADWVLWLDSDERLVPGDGPALRCFLEQGADPDEAYGFALHDQVGPGRFASEPKWVYRVHQPRAGDTMPQRRLHFPPVPTRIPRGRWLRTSVRIVHIGMATPTRRRERYRKYERTDPDRRWQDSYEHLLVAPDETIPLPARATDEVVLGVHRGPAGPDLSVVVIAHHDREHIHAVVDSVLAQEIDGEFETIVVVSGEDDTAETLLDRGDVGVIDLGPSVSPGAARNAARTVVTGDFIVFVGSHVRLARGSLAARLAAHCAGWAMVTGPLIDGSTGRAGRASFFLDHAASAPNRSRARLLAPPPRCSYVRFALERAGWFADVRAGEDTEVNDRLSRAGFTAGFEPGAVEIYVPDVPDVAALWRKHHQRGQALARLRDEHGARPVRLGVGYTSRRLHRTISHGIRHPDRWAFMRSLPLVVVGVLAARSGLVAGPPDPCPSEVDVSGRERTVAQCRG